MSRTTVPGPRGRPASLRGSSCDHRTISHDERVVIRSSWFAAFANWLPVGVVLLGLQVWERSVEGVVIVLLVSLVITGYARHINYVELTAEGLGIHWIRMSRVAWHHVGSVDRVGSLGSYELKIFDRALNIRRRLPAPRGAFGIGKAECAQARELIETWWVAHRGSPPPVPARPTWPGEPSGPRTDPWAPPPEG
jgi:hypothetical protein